MHTVPEPSGDSNSPQPAVGIAVRYYRRRVRLDDRPSRIVNRMDFSHSLPSFIPELLVQPRPDARRAEALCLNGACSGGQGSTLGGSAAAVGAFFTRACRRAAGVSA
jgi:hypothetical protein